MNNNYKQITVRDLVNAVTANKKQFPNGLDTVIVSGDFEGNYTHQKHEIMHDGNKLCLGYEMHEGWN